MKKQKNICRMIFFMALTSFSFFSLSAQTQGLVFEPNRPVGEAQGIYPGRVVMARDARIAKWDGTTGRWWDEGNIDQVALDRLYDKSICELAGTKDSKSAWKRIFKY